MNNEIMNEKIARYFCEHQIKAHITRNDGVFLNGLIGEVGSNFFLIDDDVNGHLAVFFSELKYPIEEFQEAGK